MRNLDSCRCWRCTLCPCKVRNKFLVNFWNRTILLCIPCIFTPWPQHNFYFSSPKCSERLCRPCILLLTSTRHSFSRDKAARTWSWPPIYIYSEIRNERNLTPTPKLVHNFQLCPCKYCTIPMVYERVGNETRNQKTTESHAFVYVMSRKASDITGRLRLFSFVNLM